MKALQNINTAYVIALDIETVRITEHHDNLSDQGQDAWENKNKNKGEIPDNLDEEWVKQGSLFPEFAKICCISVAFQYNGKLQCRTFTSTDERSLLREFGAFVDKVASQKGDWRFCGHAMKFFDVPFICKRFIINNLQPPVLLDESDAKPWEQRTLDTNVLWKSFGTGAGSSLNALCFALGIPSPKVDLVGDEVGKAYYNGELLRIANYCNLDTISTYNVLRRMKLESTFSLEEVVFHNPEDIIVDVPLLEGIRNSRNITAPQFKEIQDYCKGLVQDEITVVKKILTAALIDDKGKVKVAHQKYIDSLN